MTDLDAAAAFVEAEGGPLERARLRALRDGEPAPPEALPAPGADGGFAASWSAGASSLDATCFVLDQLADLGAEADPLRAGAVAFLQARRRADGSWQEDEALADATPLWARPGDEAATVYVTASCGYWCDSGRAAAWLAARVGDGRLPSFLQAQWLAAALLRRHGYAEAQGLVAGLAGRVTELEPTALAWLAATLPAEPVAAAARELLAARQEPDGRWRSEDGPELDVAATLAALRVLA